MKSFGCIIVALTFLTGWKNPDSVWITKHHKRYSICYTSADSKNLKEYDQLLANGIRAVKSFFHSPFRNHFSVYIHPGRQSLDSAWQQDWGMPDFKSECWMVASGVAAKLDMISPKLWDTQSCEHKYADQLRTQQLITHELVHVFHGQLNASPDFSNVEGIDWFVEGLATFASGQCDSLRISDVKKAIAENKIPESLDQFWSGKIKYGISGSVVMYLNRQYGRERLLKCLSFSRKDEILAALNTSEEELLKEWKLFISEI